MMNKKHVSILLSCLVLSGMLCLQGCDGLSDSSLVGELIQGGMLDQLIGNPDIAPHPDDVQNGTVSDAYIPDEYVSDSYRPNEYGSDLPETNNSSDYPGACNEHSFGSWSVYVEATCLLDGEQYRTCVNCGYTESQAVPATGHEYFDMVCQLCNREYYSSGLQYEKDDQGYVVVGMGTCTDIEVNVPETYSGLPVHSIRAEAFRDQTQLLIVGLHDGIQTIGREAFRDCYSLKLIYIPETVTEIQPSAFFLCTGLEEIVIKEENPRYVMQSGCLIDKETNTLMCAVKEFTIPQDGAIATIGTDAFAGRTDLGHLVIPEGVIEIQANAFYCAGGLTGITLPSTLESIGYNCFNASGLTEARLPEGMIKIEDNTFNFCTELTTVYIPESVRSIGIYAFHNCTSLQTILYGGTEEQWNSMTRNPDWDLATEHYTVQFEQS